MLNRRRALMAVGESPAPILPSGYQQVEYIQSSGTQYFRVIETVQNANIKKHKMQMTVAVHGQNTGTGILIGIGSAAGYWLGVVSSGTKIGLGSSATFADINIADKHIYEIDLTQGTTTYATCDGTGQISRTQASYTYNVGMTMFAGIETGAQYFCTCRAYGAKVWYEGTLIRDLYPCYRKSDNVVGMYDIVNDQFYTNAGSGTFQKGADV